MKKIHIALIVLIAILLGVIISTVSESGTYVSFQTASENPDRTYHVIGKVNLEKEISDADLLNEKYILAQRGKKNYFLLIVQ